MTKKIKAYGVLVYKIDNGKIKILLCKSSRSLNKWGCFKGVQNRNETSKECAKREFFEESSININTFLFEDYFEQKNSKKDIGIWLVDSKKIKKIDSFFRDEELYSYLLCSENSNAKFFDIENLPEIRKKQKKLIKNVKDFLQNRSQSH